MTIGVGGSYHPNTQPVQTEANYSHPQHGIQSLSDSLCADLALPMWCEPSPTIPRLPELLIPDVSRESMFEMDGIALAALRPFETHAKAESNPASTPLPPPSPADKPFLRREVPSLGLLYDRSETLSPARLALCRNETGRSGRHEADGSEGITITPLVLPLALGYPFRRQSAPSLRHVTSRPQLATLPTETLVAPIRLSRPLRPLKSPSGIEVWWPATSTGSIRVHVFISSWLFANPEKLTRNFDLPQLRASSSEPQASCVGERPCSVNRGVVFSRLTPGTILPIPGDTPMRDIVPRRRFSTASPHTPTSSAFVSGRKTYQNEFPPEAIDNEVALHHLPILGAILMQSKRPIKQDDKVILPLPFPSAWTETIKYVCTGDAEFLSEAVKGNIANLGGRV